MCLLSVCLAVLGAKPAQAQLTFELTPPLLEGFAGTTITFSGTLTNTGTSTLFLNSLGLNFFGEAGTYLENNDPANLFPSSLAAGDTYTGDLFTLDVSSGVPDDTVLDGQASFQGGETVDDFSDLASQNFQVHTHNVSAVSPEPGSLAFLAFALSAGVGGFGYRRVRGVLPLR